MTTLKKIKNTQEKTKITLCLSKEAIELYRNGKKNGWDTPDLSIQAIEKILLENKDKLLKKAN